MMIAATNWKKNYTNYFSYHILVNYLGDYIPKYTVLENPDGDGWVIGIFFSFIGEYAPLEEDDEPRLVFNTEYQAKQYVDTLLSLSESQLEIEIAGCFQHKCGHQEIVQGPLIANDEPFTLNMFRKRASISECNFCLALINKTEV